MQFIYLFIISKENKYINIFAKYIFKAPLRLFLTTGWDWGIFQCSCAGGFTFFPSFLPKARWVCVSRDGWSCWTSEEKLKSSAKAFLFFSAGCLGDIWGFFLCFPLFSMADKVSYLACHTSGWQHNLSWESRNSLSTAEEFCWELFMENPQDTNHLHLIPIKCPQNPALGNHQGGIPLLTNFGSPI